MHEQYLRCFTAYVIPVLDSMRCGGSLLRSDEVKRGEQKTGLLGLTFVISTCRRNDEFCYRLFKMYHYR